MSVAHDAFHNNHIIMSFGRSGGYGERTPLLKNEDDDNRRKKEGAFHRACIEQRKACISSVVCTKDAERIPFYSA